MSNGSGSPFGGLLAVIERRKQEGKEAAATRRTLKVLDPENSAQYEVLSGADAKGALTGLLMKSKLAEVRNETLMRQAQLLEAEARRQELLARARLTDQEVESNTALGQAVAEGEDQGAPETEVPGGLWGQRFVLPAEAPMNLARAVRLHPAAVNARAYPSLLERAAQLSRATGARPELSFSEDPVSGTRFATYGNVLSPSGVNPARLNSEAVPIVQGENTVGYRYNTPKGPNIHWLPESGFPAGATIEARNGINVVVDKPAGRILKTVGGVNALGIMLAEYGAKAGTPTAASERKAEGGYIIGDLYAGRKYLGGHIGQRNSWE